MMVFSVHGLAQTSKQTAPISKTNSNGIAVLELFTSQGCSSCPPADVVLSKIRHKNNPNVIALAFHVDYWNYIGWKDPFSKTQFTERQQEYARNFNSSGVYTPQLVINGKHELVGSKEKAIADLVAIEKNIQNTTSIEINSTKLENNQLIVRFKVFDTNHDSKINLALVKKKSFTKIKRDENNGLEHTSYNIVYDFKSVFAFKT